MSDLDAFSTLPAPLASALRKHGFSELTPVQQAVLAPDLQGKDLRISSRTGSGKTVALGLTVGPLLIDRPPVANAPASLCARPRVLLVAPTRELAAQIGRELEWLFAELRVGVCVVTGGTSVSGERRLLTRGPQVVVGTPGRLCDHLARGALDLRDTEAVVLDEADQMLELGFREPLETLLGGLPSECRRHLVSATFPRPVLALAAQYQTNAVMVTGGAPETAHEDITHLAYLMHPRERYAALVNVLLVAPDERTLVFVRTRADAAEVAARLVEDGFRAGALSGELAQAERTRALDAFRKGSLAIMVCTDVASRGIDVPEISRVIHAELPSDPQVLTHRSGRTGRAGRKGTSIMMVAANERGAAEMLLVRARIHAQLLPAPDANEVHAAGEQRLFEELTGDLESASTLEGAQLEGTDNESDAESPSPDQVEAEFEASELAKKLIETLGAEKAITRLLEKLRAQGPTAPLELTPVPLKETRYPTRTDARAPQRRAPMQRRARHG
jgi:ATP-dependent RNA helicase DeaD